MARSGITVDRACVQEFEKMKLRHHLKYIIFKFTKDLQRIEVDKMVQHQTEKVFDLEDSRAYEDFIQCLPEDHPRYAVFDLHYSLGESGDRQKLFFMIWCPDNSNVRERMLISSSKDDFRKQLIGISHDFHVSDKGDIDLMEIAKTVSKNFTA